MWISLPTLWVDPLAHHKLLEEDRMKPRGSGEPPHEDDMIGFGGLFSVSMDDAKIEPPPQPPN